MAKISVIIPIYNVEKYLDRCMNSILNQTLEDIEIILVDDGSPDNCPQMCDEYAAKDTRIKVVHKKNQGLGLARNSGLEIATGEFVSFVDSDDYIKLDTYEKVYERIKETDSDICVFSYQNKKDSGEEEPKVIPIGNGIFEHEGILNTVLPGMIGAPSEYHRDSYIGMSVCKCIYSKKIIDSYNIRFKSEREFISEDIIFQLTILPLVSRLVTMKDMFYYYCKNEWAQIPSLTNKYDVNRFNRYKMLYLKEIEILKGLNIDGEGKKRAARMFLGNCRVCIKQISTNPNLTTKQKRKLVSDICNDSVLQDVLKWYRWNKNPFKQQIVTVLLKLKLSSILLIITK